MHDLQIQIQIFNSLINNYAGKFNLSYLIKIF